MVSRRKFAALLAAGAAGAPLLHRLGRPRVIAQPGAGVPIRFLAVRTPHGTDRDFWIPKHADGRDPTGADMDLMELTFDYDLSILSPLRDWRHKITVLDGLDTQVTKEGTRGGVRTAHGHNEQGTLLTGAQPPEGRNGEYGSGHPSLDFFLHAELGAPALITAGVEGSGSWKAMSYNGNGSPRNPEQSPVAVFDQCFPSGWEPPETMEEPGPTIDYAPGETAIRLYQEQQLTALRARVEAIEIERAKIDAHLGALSILPRGGTGTGPGGGTIAACTTTRGDRPSIDSRPGTFMGVEAIARVHAQVIAQAFACGRARCATLQVLNDYPNYFTDVPEVREAASMAGYGADYRFHENLVHDYWQATGSRRDILRRGFTAGLRWSATHFAAILDELDALEDPYDPGRTILDNTVVFWHNEFGHDGHDNQHTRHPAVIAGGGGGALRMGRYLRLRNIASDDRVPHNRLLTSILHAMGRTDMDFFGDRDLVGRPAYSGPLTPLMA